MTKYSKTPPLTESDVLSEILELIPKILQPLKVLDVKQEYRVEKDFIDLVVTVKMGTQKRNLICEIKAIGEPRLIAQSALQLHTYSSMLPNSYPVFVAPYISERGRELCKELGIGYIDLMGNCFLSFDLVVIDRISPSKPRRERRPIKSILAPRSSRVVRKLLLQPKKRWKLLDLSKEVNVSVALVYKVVTRLIEEGFAERDKMNHVMLTKPANLLESTAENYEFTRNRIRSYYTFDRNLDAFMRHVAETSEKVGVEYAMTLLSGASLIAPFVRYADVSFFVASDVPKWIKALDLRPVETGANIRVIEPFDQGVFQDLQFVDNIKVVSNIQLFWDLYNYPARGREQAEYLRKEVIGY